VPQQAREERAAIRGEPEAQARRDRRVRHSIVLDAGIDSGRERPPPEPPFVPMAAALSLAVSHAEGGVRCLVNACRSNWRRVDD
jgi:hypothetical protein